MSANTKRLGLSSAERTTGIRQESRRADSVELWMKGKELVCPFESMEEKAAYIHGGQGLLGRDAS